MTDRFTVRAVVIGLIVIVVAGLAGIIALTATGHSIPDVLQNVTVGALTSLGTLLAKTNTEVQPVHVVDQPVATTDVPTPAKRGRRGSAGHMDGVAVVIIAVVVVALLILFGVLR